MCDDWRNSHWLVFASTVPNRGDPPFPIYLQGQILHSTFISWYDIWLCAFISQCWMSWRNGVLGVFLETNPTTTMNSNNLTIIYRGDYEPCKNRPKPNIFQLTFASAESQMGCGCSTATLHRLSVARGSQSRSDGPNWFQLKSFTFADFTKLMSMAL